MTDVLIDARRGAGSSLEILYGTVTWKPTLTHSRGTSLVLPAPTTYDLVDGQVVATNVQPTPEPVAGQIEWAYEVTFKDRHSKSYSFLVGVPDSTTQVNFISLPRYFETKPPLFGQGPQGDPGESATVAVGTVTEGTTAQVNNSGTNTDAVLDFVLPQGPQGPKGDGVTILDTTFAALPDTYGNGTTIGSATVASGWPVEGTSQTDRRSAASVIQTLVSTDGSRAMQRSSNGGVWTEFREFAWNTVATTTADGLMSSADKSKLDDIGILGYQSKSATDNPSTYPEGTTIGVFATSQGWPVVPGGNPAFTIVKTENTRGFNSAVQWGYAYKNSPTILQEDSPVIYRQGFSADGWGEWQTLATMEGVREYSGQTNVKDFGAVGDGVTDDTVAIQMALDSGAKTVYVPDGVYLISASLNVRADTHFYTNSATLKLADGASPTQFMQVAGSYLSSNDRELSIAVDRGARTLTTKTAHPYQPGDTLRLVSQRVSTNPDDAGDEQLGWATIGGQGPYFSEVVRVQNVPSSNTLTLDTGLLFNGYRPDKSLESDVSAGNSAVLKRTNGSGDNVRIEGFRLEGEASYGVRAIRGKNIKIVRVSWTRNLPGRFIQLADTWYSEVIDCYIETRQWEQSDEGVDHAAINQYHTAGAWQSGFTRCFSIRGTQPFDFTYSSTVLYPSVYCYVRDSETISSLANPITAHPGTYGISVLNNRFLSNQKSGISIRSNHAEVRGNTIIGSNYSVSAGIYFLEGGGKDSVASDNIIENFSTGIRINDGGNKPFGEKINIKIQNNAIRNFNTGFLVTRLSGRPIPSVSQGIELLGNRFETDIALAVGVLTCENGRGIRGLIVQGNTFVMGSVATTNNTAILVTANSKDTYVRGNNFARVGKVLDYDATGYLSSGDVDNVVLSDALRVSGGFIAIPADTLTFQVTCDSSTLLVCLSANMNTMLSAKRFRVGSASEVSTGQGFPVDNVTGWGEIIPLTGGAVAQKFHVESTTAPVLWTRRITPTGQAPWMKLSYTS